jgi:multidrug efflux pump
VNPPPILGLGTTGGFNLFLQDKGNLGQEALFNASQAVLAAARQQPTLNPMATYSFATLGVPRVAIDIDRERAIAQGLSLHAIFEALQGYFGQRYVNDFNTFGRTWQVHLQAEASARDSSTDLQRLKIRAPNGDLVPLASLITLRETAGPERTMHYNTFEAIDISGSPAPGVAGDIAKASMEQVLADTLPPGIDYEWTDLTYQQILAGNAGLLIFPICVILVIMVLEAVS